MADMLVKLYDNRIQTSRENLQKEGIVIKRGMALDKHLILGFVRDNFSDISEGWTGECELALMQQPSTCFIAVKDKAVIGFCCYDGTAKGMLGPLGVKEDYRRRGIAGALLSATLAAMKEAGYAYAVIGWVSSEAFYAKHCGAITIPGSFPGVYSRMINQ